MGCKVCKNSGIIVSGDSSKPCKCVLQENILNYCEHYAQFKFDKKYATDNLAKNNLFTGLVYDRFGTIVKSFLSYLYLKGTFVWYDSTGGDVVRANFNQDELYVVEDYVNCDFLILKLGRDSQNKSMGMWLLNLLTKRNELGNITWIFVYPDTDFMKLHTMYGDELMSYIKMKENFTTMRG